MEIGFRAISEARLLGSIHALKDAVDAMDVLTTCGAAANVLGALYPLKVLWRNKLLGPTAFDEFCRNSDTGQVLSGLTHLRGRSVHGAVVQGHFDEGTYAKHYYDHFGVWTWSDEAELKPGEDLSEAYSAVISGREILPTLPLLEKALMTDLPALNRA